ncbi:YbaB/EbfC family nucleoid-associated protein [soil metagenome]
MLDAFKNMAGLGDMMKKAQEMQVKMQQMQEELSRRQITAEAADGMVSATVDGKLQLVKLKIDQTKVDLNDIPYLEDVIVAAVSAAQTKAGQIIQAEMAKVTGDLGLPPGMLP